MRRLTISSKSPVNGLSTMLCRPSGSASSGDGVSGMGASSAAGAAAAASAAAGAAAVVAAGFSSCGPVQAVAANRAS